MHLMICHASSTCQAIEDSKRKQILHGTRSTPVVLCFNKSGRAEPTKKLFRISNLCDARTTLVGSKTMESGRAEI